LPGLSREDAATYADMWAVTPNPAYRYFGKIGTDDGADCTNFVSQATHAGGYPMADVLDPQRSWFYYGDYWYSNSWTVVWDFLDFFYEMGYGEFWGLQTGYGSQSPTRIIKHI
jgi:hypothetical protein